MSSGRSARLPPTPTQNANNKHRAATGAEPNSNNMMQYSNSSATANGSAAVPASGLGSSSVLQMGGMNLTMGMSNMSSGSIGPGYGLGTLSGGSVSISTSDAATESIPGETIDVLGPELAVATSQVLENLSENERKMIIEVLNRDDSVRQRDATRIMWVPRTTTVNKFYLLNLYFYSCVCGGGMMKFHRKTKAISGQTSGT